MEALHGGDGDPVDPPETIDRRSRLRICGLVEFSDDGDGRLDANDTIVRSDLARFGSIETTDETDAWEFSSLSEKGDLQVTARVPMDPDASAPLIVWTVRAQPVCAEGASHFAVLLDQSDPRDDERFLTAACSAELMATGEA
jgi:hypothetical protein